jgi:hypothetical protein
MPSVFLIDYIASSHQAFGFEGKGCAKTLAEIQDTCDMERARIANKAPGGSEAKEQHLRLGERSSALLEPLSDKTPKKKAGAKKSTSPAAVAGPGNVVIEIDDEAGTKKSVGQDININLIMWGVSQKLQLAGVSRLDGLARKLLVFCFAVKQMSMCRCTGAWARTFYGMHMVTYDCDVDFAHMFGRARGVPAQSCYVWLSHCIDDLIVQLGMLVK